LKRNGSIVQVSFPARFEPDDPVSSKVMKRVDIFCTRNQNIAILLSNGKALSGYDATEGSMPHADIVALIPSHFLAALPARRLAANNLLCGLLSASDNMGPFRLAKRAYS
jgi:hypothetical protein